VKDLHCRDAGMDCDYVARGETNDDIKRQAADHARTAHGMSVTPQLEQRIESLIHDENSEACRRSTARR
jgi:predicted small metal-binding protein